VSKTRTAPWDHDRRPWLSSVERDIDRLPLEWHLRWQAIFFTTPPSVSQRDAYLQVLAEMHPDECRCCLPEQTCAADRHLEAAYDDQTELPY
jgi:hypothetical protein